MFSTRGAHEQDSEQKDWNWILDRSVTDSHPDSMQQPAPAQFFVHTVAVDLQTGRLELASQWGVSSFAVGCGRHIDCRRVTCVSVTQNNRRLLTMFTRSPVEHVVLDCINVILRRCSVLFGCKSYRV